MVDPPSTLPFKLGGGGGDPPLGGGPPLPLSFKLGGGGGGPPPQNLSWGGGGELTGLKVRGGRRRMREARGGGGGGPPPTQKRWDTQMENSHVSCDFVKETSLVKENFILTIETRLPALVDYSDNYPPTLEFFSLKELDPKLGLKTQQFLELEVRILTPSKILRETAEPG